MHFDYVDIGTCDFDTCLDFILPDETALLVEPLKFYLDRLPDLPNVYKENSAVSNEQGLCLVKYIPLELINFYNLPQWFKGCNSVEEYHLAIFPELTKNNLTLDIVKTAFCKKITFNNLCKKYYIQSIGSLKIDTEGHEQYILPDVLEKVKQGLKINKICFENQEYLGNAKLLDNLTKEFLQLGYLLTDRTFQNVELTMS